MLIKMNDFNLTHNVAMNEMVCVVDVGLDLQVFKFD